MKLSENLKYMSVQKAMRIAFLLIFDVCAILISEYMAIITRFDFSIANVNKIFLDPLFSYSGVNVFCTIVIFILLQLYTSLWAFAGVRELVNSSVACLMSAVLQLVGMVMMDLHMPRSYYILYLFYLLAFIISSRFAYRSVRSFLEKADKKRGEDGIPTMIIGAGDTAYSLIRDMQRDSKIANRAVCLIDSNRSKIGRNMLGVPIVGDDEVIHEMVERYAVREIIIAIGGITNIRKKELIELCKDTGCRLRIIPGASKLVSGEVTVSSLRDVSIEDLLGRDQVKTDLDQIVGYISNRTVLVTGGGGSIGSELCRQIAAHKPKKLIIFDIYENTTYDLQIELARTYPTLDMEVLIGSVRNTHRVETIFAKYKPQIVFHAAAHKHVPLMEDSPNEAIKNNVFGTYNVAKAAAESGCRHFVLISTDKAVNPTNIMGASKRICEMVVQGMAKKHPDTQFVAVRFGNVLGSNGSVIPLFKKQIEEGGPVTVTDKNIIRYFMTIPEAVSLVLQAGAFAKGGEIFVLDMGEPIKIDDMARNLIRLSGLEPDVDIRIEYTGLRPGEKLFEECLKDEEGLEKTANNLIFIGKPIAFDVDAFFDSLKALKDAAYDDSEDIKKIVHEMVPSYTVDER